MTENNFPELNHLLYDHGILKSFNVNRRVTKSEINKIAKSMGMDEDKVDINDVQNIISTLSAVEYSCGDVPGTKNCSSRSLKQFQQNYDKLFELMTYSSCVLDLLGDEKLQTNEKIFILNKCISDLQTKG